MARDCVFVKGRERYLSGLKVPSVSGSMGQRLGKYHQGCGCNVDHTDIGDLSTCTSHV